MRIGSHHSEESIKKISESKLIDNPGYWAIHKWIVKHFGRADHCENCGLNDESRRYEWANISGLYLRSRDDFLMLCVPCHRATDGMENIVLYRWRKN